MNSTADGLPHLSKIACYGIASLFGNSATKEKSLHAGIAMRKRSVFANCQASATLTKPNKYTVQAGEEKHIVPSPAFLQYLNHHCNPNIFFDTEKMELISLHNIAIGDELTIFYPSTEWRMSNTFQCFCESPACIRHIRGAAYLSKEILEKYRFTNFIREKLRTANLQPAIKKSSFKKVV